MASENGLSPRLAAFQGDSFPFSCVDGERSSQGKVRPAGFAAVGGDKIFSGEREGRFLSDLHGRRAQTQGWGGFMDGGSHSGDGPNDEEEEDEDAEGNEEDEDVDDGDGLVSLEEGNNKINYNSSGSVQSSSDKICDERTISQEHHSSFGSGRGVLLKDGNGGRGCLEDQSYEVSRMDACHNAVTVMETEPYYAHALPGADGLSHHKEDRGENGCGFNGRKEAGLTTGYWETLRTQLSDPTTGALMDDAMILSCGHSFGNSGMQRVYKMVQPVFTMAGTGGSGLQIVSEKLSETNYASWAVAVELYVEGHDKLDILHGTKVKPDEKDPSFHTWRRDNIQLMTWMLNSVNSGIKQVILHNKTAYDMWKTLEQMYGRRHDMLRTYQISSQIFKLEQGSMSVTNYFATLKRLWDEFDYYRMENWSSTDDHQRYLKVLEKDRIIKFLDGLTAEFESLKGQILGLDPIPSLEQLESEETIGSSVSSITGLSSTDIVNLQHLLSRLQASSSASTPADSTPFQAHTGIRGLRLSVTGPSSYNPWVIDSGASDHMTNAANSFISYSLSSAQEKVIIADGTKATVAGKGSIKLTDHFFLSSALHVPSVSINLLSVSSITKQLHCSVTFFPDHCVFQDLETKQTIGTGREVGGLYYYQLETTFALKSAAKCLGTKHQEILLWHSRLGHFYPNIGENITSSFVPQVVVPQVVSSPIPLDVIENRKDASSLGKDAPLLGAQSSPDIITYKRRRHKQEPPIDRLVESDALTPDPLKQLSSSVEPTAPLNMNELDLPVAVRKGDDEVEIQALKSKLTSEFEIKDLGSLKYFLGIEVARSKEGIYVCQRKYVLDLLKETGKLGSRPASTPIEVNHDLTSSSGEDLTSLEKGAYQRLFMYAPKTIHMKAGDRILRYLKSCPEKGLLFKGGGDLKKACITCSQPVSDYSVRPNLTLRAAVQAFRREEELHLLKASRRKREKFEQEKCNNNDLFSMDLSRGKGVQFPFAVSDRVIIKGNKRTPQRFVGRVAVVTAQCLNGWYVVKTLDNAESVKLQYRSLEKLMDDQGTEMIPDKTLTPNWL
ncbi:hypothetical protein ZIOFF_040386 [Zingiber officinale]|uniref:Uncharacterized protein n=1 Tax=Zingiber officinale TaxID=94328 RepID=A0A8J5G3V7_ZINOF|nr:hypothetical protein ZIOFF_040386 [Zingiber officinale]